MFDATKKKAFVYDAKTDYKFETFSKWIEAEVTSKGNGQPW